MMKNYFGNFENEEAYKNLAEKLENKIDVSKYDFIQLNSLLFKIILTFFILFS